MTIIYVGINGTETRCHQLVIPQGTGPGTSQKNYPEGTCPFYRQWPNGTRPECICGASGQNVALVRDSDGYALRTEACRAEEVVHQGAHKRALQISATEEHCTARAFAEAPLPEHPDPRKKNSSGNPVVFPNGTACAGYEWWPAGDSLCRFSPHKGQKLRRDVDGETKRLAWCKNAEVAPE